MICFKMISVLFFREVCRLRKNPSALVMLGLLTAIALMMALSGEVESSAEPQPSADTGTIGIIVDHDTPEVRQLRSEVPEHLDVRIELRSRLPGRDDVVYAPSGWSIVELHNDPSSRENPDVVVHYVGATPNDLQPFMDWFVPAVARMRGSEEWISQAWVKRPVAATAGLNGTSFGELMKTEVLGTTLLLMVQFFACCHLLVSFTAQDRERGTLTALALSPARLSEIMLAKGLFHLMLSVAGSVVISAIVCPAVMMNPVFWCTIFLTSTSMMCVGTCIATLAKNQATAGMLALCYMMAGAILFFLSTKFAVFAVFRRLTIECYSFNLLFMAFKHPGLMLFLRALVPMAALTALWVFAARTCFYRFGWRQV